MTFLFPQIFETTPPLQGEQTVNPLSPILPMDESAWEAHRPEIERLYLKEKVTLDELVKIMCVEYKFKKT
jgi:hypothetical protein